MQDQLMAGETGCWGVWELELELPTWEACMTGC